MRLQTKRKWCVCGGVLGQHKDRSSKVTIYTESGPILVEHLECRCRTCSKGYFYGYTSDCSGDDQEKAEMNDRKRQFKYYEEDCLEAEVGSIYSEFFVISVENLISDITSLHNKVQILKSRLEEVGNPLWHAWSVKFPQIALF